MKKKYLTILFSFLIILIFSIIINYHSVRVFYLRQYLNYHYNSKSDSLKRDAAAFLLNNIEYKCSIEADGSIIKDVDLIKPSDLIINIDFAFKAWKLDWSKDYSFENFCEFILPYRVYNEPFSSWREKLYGQMLQQLDSIQKKRGQTLNKTEVVQVVNDFVAFRFKFDDSNSWSLSSVNDELIKMNGNCKKRYLLIISALRSVGIACGIDFTPLGLCWHQGHDWTFYMNKNQDFVPFNGGEIFNKDISNFPKDKRVPIPPGSATVVYRKYYSINRNNTNITDKNFQSYYHDLTLRNVSSYYVQSETNLSFKIKNDGSIKKVFLFGFGLDKNIIPISVSDITNDSAHFLSIGYSNVYVLGYYNADTIRIIDYPFFVWGDKKYSVYKPFFDKKIKTGKIFRKFKKSWNESVFSNEMLNAEIQVSSDRAFKKNIVLYKVKDVPQTIIDTSFRLGCNKYKYIKYKSFSTTGIHLSTFNFYQGGNSLIKSEINPKDAGLSNLLDNDIRTNFNTYTRNELIFSLKNITNLDSCFRLELFYRNSFNTIEKGEKYELLFFDKGWQKYSIEKASNNYIILKNVPSNYLWLIRRISDDREHRIFVFDDNGNQCFL